MKTRMLIALWLAHTAAFAAEPYRSARVQLAPFNGAQVGGTVELVQRGDTVQVFARLSGLTPGLHAFHLHRRGDCTNAAATGDHYDPDGDGKGPRSEHHGGEFGAIVADGEGQASLNLLLTGLSLGDGPHGVNGRSIVVHSSPDDFLAWPAPTTGMALACGVIRTI